MAVSLPLGCHDLFDGSLPAARDGYWWGSQVLPGPRRRSVQRRLPCFGKGRTKVLAFGQNPGAPGDDNRRRVFGHSRKARAQPGRHYRHQEFGGGRLKQGSLR